MCNVFSKRGIIYPATWLLLFRDVSFSNEMEKNIRYSRSLTFLLTKYESSTLPAQEKALDRYCVKVLVQNKTADPTS
jgi:hypothetical protein